MRLAICGLAAFAMLRAASSGDGYSWNLPKGFPKPPVPVDNPMTAAKVELGRYLFYDERMSVNGKGSCATCHKQELAFTDGRTVAVGTTGEHHSRNAMSLVNIAYSGVLTWSNPAMRKLEEQALTPMFGEHPIELGLRKDDGFIARLRSDVRYGELFARAFPGEPEPFVIGNVTKAIASFERSIISARSPYDRYHYDRDDSAVSDSAKRGEILFFNQQLSCFRCHAGFNFSDATVAESNAAREVELHNTGLGGSGKFKAPTLRNIAVTAPYMHDGSVPTLDAVLDHYSAGGRNGHDSPGKDSLIGGFTLSKQDRADLIEFLRSLTDEKVLHDHRFANPWNSTFREARR
jgi:cytochrome c peroxidase